MLLLCQPRGVSSVRPQGKLLSIQKFHFAIIKNWVQRMGQILTHSKKVLQIVW